MTVKQFTLESLQPGDYLRKSSFEFLNELSTPEIHNLGTLQVYQTPRGFVLIEGSNRAKVFLDIGLTTIAAEYVPNDEIPPYIAKEVDEVLLRVGEMIKRGINSISNLTYE